MSATATNYIHPRAAARRANLHPQTFYRFLREGRMPGVAVRFGPKCIRIDARKFQKFLEAGGVAGPETSEPERPTEAVHA